MAQLAAVDDLALGAAGSALIVYNAGNSQAISILELGNGVTRNAVIGKVHRLGLSGRAKAPAPHAPHLRWPQVQRHLLPRLHGRQSGQHKVLQQCSPFL